MHVEIVEGFLGDPTESRSGHGAAVILFSRFIYNYQYADRRFLGRGESDERGNVIFTGIGTVFCDLFGGSGFSASRIAVQGRVGTGAVFGDHGFENVSDGPGLFFG